MDIKKLKRIYKKYKKLILIGLIALLFIELVLVLISEKEVNRFSRTVKRGLEAGWSEELTEIELQSFAAENSTAFIDREYEAIEQYIGKDFRKLAFNDAAQMYIDAVVGCKEVAATYDPNVDFDEFWTHFSEYYGQRIKALYLLDQGRYTFELSSRKHPEQCQFVKLNGWALNKTEEIQFKQVDKTDEYTLFKATVTNDSGYKLAYFNLDIEMIDKGGNVVETVSAFADDWKRGEEKTLQFYVVSSKFERYRIVSETCGLEETSQTSEEVENESEETEQE